MLLNRRLGSWFVLAALLSSETLVYDSPQETEHCGSCRRCLDACPTGALAAPYRLDARKCISCLTIEWRGPLPTEFRTAIGQRIFGCDACQEACPWNAPAATATGTAALGPLPGNNPVELAELLSLDEDGFQRRFGGTALLRVGRAGLLHRAAIALANRPCESALPALRRGLDDPDPLVSQACAWALGQGAVARQPRRGDSQ
jgi:epoxyqueuosine reductase